MDNELKTSIYSVFNDSIQSSLVEYDNADSLKKIEQRKEIVNHIAKALNGLFYLEMISGGIKEQ